MLKSTNINKKKKEDLYKWRGKLCSWIRNFNIIKMSILPNLIYKARQSQSECERDFV